MDFKKLAIAGGALLGFGSLAYYFLQNNKAQSVKSNGKILQREVVIRTLKSLNKELFTVCLQICMMAQQMKKYSQGRLDYDIKDFIFSYPAINQEMKLSINKAYDKNNVTEVDFQYNCEVTYADDKEIQYKMKQIKVMIDNCAEGKDIDMKTDIPDFLTKDMVLEILQKIMKDTTKQMQHIFKKIKEQYGQLNLNDPRIARQLQGLETDSIKTSIFQEYKLDDFDESAHKIISYATQKYTSEIPEFQQEMVQLELKQRKSMEVIMQNPDDEKIVDKIFDEPIPDLSMGSGLGGQFPGFHAQKKKSNASNPIDEIKKTDSQGEIKQQNQNIMKNNSNVSNGSNKEKSLLENEIEEKQKENVEKNEEQQISEQKVDQLAGEKSIEHSAYDLIKQSVEGSVNQVEQSQEAKKDVAQFENTQSEVIHELENSQNEAIEAN